MLCSLKALYNLLKNTHDKFGSSNLSLNQLPKEHLPRNPGLFDWDVPPEG